MVGVNTASVFFYSRMFNTLKTRPGLFLKLVFSEIIIHMMLAIVCVGWDCGFQQYCFCIVGIAFFTNYIITKDGAEGFSPLALCIVSAIVYLFSIFVGVYLEPVYRVSQIFKNVTFTVNGIMVLGLVTIFSYIYVTHIQQSETDLMDVAEYDALTQLANRHRIDRVLPIYGIDKNSSGVSYSAAIMDIDNFKKVNDNFGHLAGDQVLRDIARILRNYESNDVLAFRWGGEEFMIIMIGDDNYNRLMELCEKIRSDVAANVTMFEYFRIVVTISAGVASSIMGEDFKALTERADKCLYHAKGNGKNQVVGSTDFLGDDHDGKLADQA